MSTKYNVGWLKDNENQIFIPFTYAQAVKLDKDNTRLDTVLSETAETIKSHGDTISNIVSTNDSSKVKRAEVADKTQHPLKFGTKSFDGSEAKEITADDLGITKVLTYLGISTEEIKDGGTENPVIGDNTIKTEDIKEGSVVLYKQGNELYEYIYKEFIWNGSNWEELGDENSYAFKSVKIIGGEGLSGEGYLSETEITLNADVKDPIIIDKEDSKITLEKIFNSKSNPLGQATDVEIDNANTISIPHFEVDEYGRITSASSHEVKLNLKSIIDAIGSLNDTASDINESIRDLQGQIQSNDGDITELQKGLQKLDENIQENIDDIIEVNTTQNDAINTLSADVSELHSRTKYLNARDEDGTFYIVDKDGNVIFKVDDNGTYSTDFTAALNVDGEITTITSLKTLDDTLKNTKIITDLTSNDTTTFSDINEEGEMTPGVRGVLSPKNGGTGNVTGRVQVGQKSGEDIGENATSEGYNTIASGKNSHAEGNSTIASGNNSHSEGYLTVASNLTSHAEGHTTTASGSISHAEGYQTTASGNYSHSEGYYTTAEGNYSHAEGQYTTALGVNSHAEGYSSTFNITITGEASATTYILSSANVNIKIGQIIKYNGICAEITAYDSSIPSITLNKTLSNTALNRVSVKIYRSVASGRYSHAEGNSTIASGESSHAEGNSTTAFGNYSHAEGYNTEASGNYGSHAEGYQTEASGKYSHAEGNSTIASGESSHAEGGSTEASGDYSHAEGNSMAIGIGSHAEGKGVIAEGKYSHAEGKGNTIKGLIAGNFQNNNTTFYFDIKQSINIDINDIKIGGYIDNQYLITAIDIDNNKCTIENTVATYNNSIVDNTDNLIVKAIIYKTYPYTYNDETNGGKSLGDYSHIEGYKATTIGAASHAEGGNLSPDGTELEDKTYIIDEESITVYGSQAYGIQSHTEGTQALAYGYSSHAEGTQTIAYEHSSHAEGYATMAMGIGSHAEGNRPIAIGTTSHAEGSGVFSELILNPTDEENTYILINQDEDSNVYIFERDIKYDWIQLTEDYNENGIQYKFQIINYERLSTNRIKIILSNNLGQIEENTSVQLLRPTKAVATSSHAEGVGSVTNVSGTNGGGHAEGGATIANGRAHAEGHGSFAKGWASHAEGHYTLSQGQGSHAEGQNAISAGNYSHAEGAYSNANGYGSHAEGRSIAVGSYSHSEGDNRIQPIQISGAINATTLTFHGNISNEFENAKYLVYNNKLVNILSIDIGNTTIEIDEAIATDLDLEYTWVKLALSKGAFGENSHIEGEKTEALGKNSHASNLGTIAQGNNQTAIGTYNIPDEEEISAFIIGNGTGEDERSNAYTIDWDGNSIQAGTNTSTDFIIAEEEPISIKDKLNNINDTIETIITDIDIINNDICGTANESDKIVPRIYELENRTRYLNIEDEETNNDAFYITDGNGKIILEVNGNGVKSIDFMTEDGSLLPKSAGENHKLTGPLGLTEGVMYGTTLPTEVFDGQLFFLEDDIFDIPQGGKAGQALVKKTDVDGDIEWQDVSVPAANASTSGIVTTDEQTFAGSKRFTNGLVLESYANDFQTIQIQKDINYGDTPTESIKTRINFEDKNGVAYGGIVHTINEDNENRTSIINYSPKADRNESIEYAQFYIDIKNDNTCIAGVTSGSGLANDIVFMGAAWNDYAEYRDQKENIEPGYCVASTDNGQVYKTTEKFQACDGIVSDTFGFAIGQTDNCQTPLAVAGRVLAYCYGDKNDYHAGDTVCAGPEGKVIKMTREEIKEYPDRIIGIVSEIPKYETWGKGNIKVNNRIWIKVK